jgi:hypothetical protein
MSDDPYNDNAKRNSAAGRVVKGFGGDLGKIAAANRQRTRNKIRTNRAKRRSVVASRKKR